VGVRLRKVILSLFRIKCFIHGKYSLFHTNFDLIILAA
jgi:hypothetical protein